MGPPLSDAAAVRASIARRVLGDDAAPALRIGAFTLRPAQRRTLAAVRAALDEFGGALLADPPGTGKTVLALAVAATSGATPDATPAATRGTGGTLVVAPAALRAQWLAQAARAGVPIAFRSFESLSRGPARERPALLVVDEAHHAREPATRRHAHLAALCERSRVLLLTATPVVNRLADRDALLSLFLGARARALDDAARGRCIVRRRGTDDGLPPVGRFAPLRAGREDVALDAAIAAALRALPPPLPLPDGAAATALVRMSLAMAWQSSLAALDAALRRRVQRGEAMRDLLRAGRAPSRAALRHWTLHTDATQLALPLLVGEPGTPAPDAMARLDAHLRAVRALRALVGPRVAADAGARAAAVRALLDAHPARRIVLFARHAETVRALYDALRDVPGVVAIIGARVRAAAGRWSRDEVLRALGPRAPRPRDARAIRLLLTSDVLAEGVELQGADVVVHADLPWTPARLEQRLGRVRRQGRASREVLETRFTAPPAARALVRLGARLARKERARTRAVRAAESRGRIAEALAAWRSAWITARHVAAPGDTAAHGDARSPAAASAAIVRAPRAGFLAAVPIDGRWRLVAGWRAAGRWRVSSAPQRIWPLVRAAGRGRAGRDQAPAPCHEDVTRDAALHAVACRVLHRWRVRREARAIAGVDTHHGSPLDEGSGAAAVRVRRIRARLAALLSRAPTLERAALAARHAAWTARVARPMPAARERRLDALLRADIAAADFARRLAALFDADPDAPGDTKGAPSVDDAPRDIPMLLLSPGAPRPAAPAPAPPSASPGSAAPR